MGRTGCTVLKRKNTTLKEVAEHAGVSQMTVSRVLNASPLVKEVTRARVQASIEALHYRPNLMARGLAGGKSLMLGIVYFNPSSGYLSEVLIGAMRTCRELGHHAVLEDLSDVESEDLDDIVERLVSAGLDGLLITPPFSSDAGFAARLDRAGLPTVLLDRQTTMGGCSSVTFDNTAAAHAMMEYLFARGHQRIAFLSGPPDFPSAQRRLKGYVSALQAAGLSVEKDLILQGDFTFKSGFFRGEELLTRRNRPTAVFASNDDMAAGVIAAAQSLGVGVPDDVSVVGFDDTELARTIWPELTTVKHPIAEIASTGVRLLSDQRLGAEDMAPVAKVIDTIEIIERNSVKPIL